MFVAVPVRKVLYRSGNSGSPFWSRIRRLASPSRQAFLVRRRAGGSSSSTSRLVDCRSSGTAGGPGHS